MKFKIIFFIVLFAVAVTGYTGIAKEIEKTKTETYQKQLPAEIFCWHRGGTLAEYENLYGLKSTVCDFEDKSQCFLEEYFEGDCQPGDIEPIKPVVYFLNSTVTNQDECDQVYPIKYQVTYYDNWQLTVLQKLIQGPSEAETEVGYQSIFNPEADILGVDLADNVLKINFSKEIIKGIKSDCQKDQFVEQLDRTMKQFGDIKSVEVLVAGQYDDFLEK